MSRAEAVSKTRRMAKAYRGMASCQEEADALGGALAELDALRAELAELRRPSIDTVPADGQVHRRDQIVPVWCVRCPDCGNMIGYPSFGEAAGRESVAGWLPFHRIRCEGKR